MFSKASENLQQVKYPRRRARLRATVTHRAALAACHPKEVLSMELRALRVGQNKDHEDIPPVHRDAAAPPVHRHEPSVVPRH